MLLVAHPSLGVGNLRELIALAKARPNAVSAAISPIGTPNHLGVELLAQKADLDMTFVPYPGIGPAMPDLLAGRTHIAISVTSSMLPHVQSGALQGAGGDAAGPRADRARHSDCRRVRIPGFDVNAWICLMVTGGTPAPVIARLNAEVRKAMATEEVRASFARQGLEASTMSPEALGAYIKAECDKWASVLKNAKVKKQ